MDRPTTLPLARACGIKMEGHCFEIPDLASFIIRELIEGSLEEVEIPGAVCAAKEIPTEFLSTRAITNLNVHCPRFSLHVL